MEVFDAEGKSIFDIQPKKKKRYILFLFSLKREDESRIRTIEKAIQTAVSDFIMIRFEDPNEGLKALLVKNIEIVFIDSSLFNDDKTSIDFAVECKKRKKCPIFFIAKDEKVLIQEYREKLYLYEEFDDYFYDPIDFVEISKKLKRAAANLGRRAKRFSLGLPIKLFRLNTNEEIKIILSDISLVGFGIILRNDDIFKKNEQVRITVPLEEFKIFHPQYGEFLPLSGKARRISIDGKRVGFSIEHLTQMQIELLMNILETVTRRMNMIKIAKKPTIVEVTE
ncbi:PilZ domain-containing protein [Fluviispira multicolorata]|uniref:PilZ domain-containing protein n=1 Tax=Fluviispira multicolorata TaxID=2654512 RepID=A0A833JC49_9BACT|nr:PilZ domain-containing protein [Fluviispira multicolorata]KAB8030616.1 hypothetical protein GCL57_06480 [Fluviispira multicolorata]